MQYIKHMKLHIMSSDTKTRDTAMALVLLFLLGYIRFDKDMFLYTAIGLLIVAMIIPHVYISIARIWFSLSIALGKITSTILLTIVFFVILTPIAWIRRMTGYDSLLLRKWKISTDSVFRHRVKQFGVDDIIKLY